MLSWTQAVVPCSDMTSMITSMMTSMMIVKVLNTFPPGASDQNAMSKDGQQLQLESPTCYAHSEDILTAAEALQVMLSTDSKHTDSQQTRCYSASHWS